MKTWILAIVAAGVGLTVGGGLAWSEFVGARTVYPGEAPAPNTDSVPSSHPNQLEMPQVVVEGGEFQEGKGYVHQFGSLELSQSGSHTFVIRNEGKGMLTLHEAGTTCSSCTVAELSASEVPPGGEANVKLVWRPREVTEHYLHGADIRTNDPAKPLIHLAVMGRVTLGIRVVPYDLVLDSISASEPHRVSAAVYDYSGNELEVQFAGLENPDTAPFFEVELLPLSPEALAREPGAKGGVELTVTVKPGLPLGPINQKIRLTTNRNDMPEVELPLRGRVVGDITLIGSDYEPSVGILKLGAIPSDEGRAKTIHVVIKGPHRQDVQLKVKRVSPEGILQAALGDPRALNEGAVIMVPLEVKVPPGSPLVSHTGSRPGSLGEIELETTHPENKTVMVYVSFLVEKSS